MKKSLRKPLLVLSLLVAVAAFAQRPEIEPLLKSKWGQQEPYNDQCPNYYTNSGKTYRCNAGCVAVAMSQVMYYYRYPAYLPEDINGYVNLVTWTVYETTFLGIKIPTIRYAHLGTIPAGTMFLWSSMLDAYDGSEGEVARYAVSTLMLAAGESVTMRYDRSSSADPRTIARALTQKFSYAPTTRYVARANYSDEAWEQLLYDELAAGRPVIYGGLTARGSGHSFVIDGYRDGLFHVNWGNDGYYNDYFSLNQLDPYAYWGGNDGYNFEQDAIIGIQPSVTDAIDTPDIASDPSSFNVQRSTFNVYDLQGRPVLQRPLPPGIYIKNGKKFVVK